MPRPFRGSEKLSIRFPLYLTETMNDDLSEFSAARSRDKNEEIRIAVRNHIYPLPIFGAASCGEGRLADQEPLGHIGHIYELLPKTQFPVYGIEAEGDSMRSDDPRYDIASGDYLVFAARNDAANGQTVHVEHPLPSGEHVCSIKRFYRGKEGIILRSNNSNHKQYPDIKCAESDITVCGVWLGVNLRGVRLGGGV